MEDFADAAALFGSISPRDEISPIEKLLNEFEAHEAKEDRALEFYKRSIAHMPNAVTRFLMQLIVSDEEKHRAVMHAMVATLKGSLNWTKPSDSLEGIGDVSSLNGKVREITDELIGLEKAGIREYHTLVKESSGYYHGLFKVLLDSMIRDSEKHVQLLEFLKDNLKDA
jgi:bacterioferritin (cytochrome b1)